MLSNASTLHGSLPFPSLSRSIGRRSEIVEIKNLLTTTRLLSLVGIGGGGKTHLALQVVNDLWKKSEQRMCWVDLSAVSHPELIPQAIASAMGIEKTGYILVDDLLPIVQQREFLIILDNCEHLVADCAQVAEKLLSLCPTLQILATSREALDVIGEIIWLVPPLSLPDPHAPSDPTTVANAEAVQLFIERMSSLAPSFSVTRKNASTVAQICCRLEGNPLAIELAATRGKVLSVEQIALRLDDICRLLVGNHRLASPRHQTLKATIDWSYNLLSQQERTIFHRLAVFTNSFHLEAAESICAGGDIAEGDVLDILSGLVNKSLVQVEEGHGETCYRLFEMIQQYTQSKLQESGETTTLYNRQRDWYVQWVEEHQEHVWSTQQAVWFDSLETEHHNLKAVLSWTLEQEEGELLAQLCGSLWHFWLQRGHLIEGSRWLKIAQGRISGCTAIHACILHGIASFNIAQHNFVHTQALLRECLTLYLSLGMQIESTYVLASMGDLAQCQGDYEQALSYFHRARLRLQDLGNKHAVAQLLMMQGRTLQQQGHLKQAKELCEESLSLARKLNNIQSMAKALIVLAYISLDEDDDQHALAFCDESLILQERLKDKSGQAHVLAILGHIALRLGNYEQATTYYKQSLMFRNEIGVKVEIILSLEGLVEIAQAQGEPLKAAHIYGLARALQEAGSYISDADQNHAQAMQTTLREQLGEMEFARALTKGKSLSVDEVITNALDTDSVHTTNIVQLASKKLKVPETLRILAFGSSQVYLKDEVLTSAEWRYSKACELLFYLLCHRSRTKEQIGLTLWPNASSTQVRNSFHTALHYLRRALGQPDWIIYQNDLYSFNRQLPYWFDVETFERLCQLARKLRPQNPEQAIHYLKKSVHLYKGDFLQGAFDGDWYQLKQKELQKMYSGALFSLGELLFAEGQYKQASNAYQQLIAYDNFFEAAHRELMRCYERQGERSQALRHYQSFSKLISNEFGITPASETVQLFESLRHGVEI